MKGIWDEFHTRGLVVLGVSGDEDPAALARTIDRRGIAWPQLRDPKSQPIALFQQFNATLPTLYILDPQGNIVGKFRGRANPVKVRQLIEALVAQLPGRNSSGAPLEKQVPGDRRSTPVGR